MTELLLASSPGHLVVRRGGKLFSMSDGQEIELHPPGDEETYLWSLSAKWRFYRVLDHDGSWGIEVGDEPPKLRFRKSHDGEVYLAPLPPREGR